MLKKQMLRRLPQKLYASIGETGGETMKPLKDWTLEELKDYCTATHFSNYVDPCENCDVRFVCNGADNQPRSWNLAPDPPPTQEETIVWHKYPEDKPKEPGIYMVELTFNKHGNVYAFDNFRVEFVTKERFIKAWAEMPKGYQEETE